MRVKAISEGRRQILAVEPFRAKTHATWKAFFDKLKARGLYEIALLVSDAHMGIQSALKESFLGAS